MQPGQMAVVWMMYDQSSTIRSGVPARHASPRPSFKQRFGGTVRRFAFRTQLGPVGGHAQPDV